MRLDNDVIRSKSVEMRLLTGDSENRAGVNGSFSIHQQLHRKRNALIDKGDDPSNRHHMNDEPLSTSSSPTPLLMILSLIHLVIPPNQVTSSHCTRSTDQYISDITTDTVSQSSSQSTCFSRFHPPSTALVAFYCSLWLQLDWIHPVRKVTGYE